MDNFPINSLLTHYKLMGVFPELNESKAQILETRTGCPITCTDGYGCLSFCMLLCLPSAFNAESFTQLGEGVLLTPRFSRGDQKGNLLSHTSEENRDGSFPKFWSWSEFQSHAWGKSTMVSLQEEQKIDANRQHRWVQQKQHFGSAHSRYIGYGFCSWFSAFIEQLVSQRWTQLLCEKSQLYFYSPTIFPYLKRGKEHSTELLSPGRQGG